MPIRRRQMQEGAREPAPALLPLAPATRRRASTANFVIPMRDSQHQMVTDRY
jgi:hypothetical protein